MHRLYKSLLSFMILISLYFYTFTTHAEDVPQVESIKKLTVEDVQSSLKGAENAELSLQGLLDLQREGPMVILDVRSLQSHAARHIKGSINIPLTDLTEKTLAAAIPDKKKPVAVMCDFSLFPTRMLAMTIQAYPVLQASGYERIYRLNLWNNPDGQMITQEEMEKVLPFETYDAKRTPEK